MDLDDIRIFTKVVEAGSFTKAADLLGIPNSTASRRVGELEDRLGVLLLQRTTRKLNLTHAGEIYFARTSRVIEELQVAETALLELQAEPRGVLRLTTPSDLVGALPDFLMAFQEKYPEIDLIVLPTGRRVDLVAEGYDVALRAGKLSDSALVSRRLMKSNLALFASPQYLEAKGTPQMPSDLERHSCLVFSSEKLDAIWKLQGPTGHHEVNVKGRLATRDFDLMRGAAERHQGVAYMPELSGARALRAGTLVRVLPGYGSGESNLYAIYPSPRHLSPKVRAFVDFAAEWFDSFLDHCYKKCGQRRESDGESMAPVSDSLGERRESIST
jgi:DNA-binding transcriptional LysR family regulator